MRQITCEGERQVSYLGVMFVRRTLLGDRHLSCLLLLLLLFVHLLLHLLLQHQHLLNYRVRKSVGQVFQRLLSIDWQISSPCSTLFSSVLFSGVTAVMTSLVVMNLDAPYSPTPMSANTHTHNITATTTTHRASWLLIAKATTLSANPGGGFMQGHLGQSANQHSEAVHGYCIIRDCMRVVKR